MDKPIRIGGKTFGSSHPFIVAEIGINHNGDMDLAKECIAAAAEAGADSVKFQNYITEDFISDRSLMLSYKSQGKNVTEPQYDLFKRCELTLDQLGMLKDECDACGINFHSTPTSIDGIQNLLEIGCELLKNGSDYLTNLNLIKLMGETGLATVLSTGMATLEEIDQAVRAFHETGNENLILLQCTSSYPAPPEEINLARINTLSKVFDLPVGFSDHSIGATAAVCATILGACWIEKHFTMDKNLHGPDHWFSMDPTELQTLVVAIREAENMIGSAKISPTESEQRGRIEFRLSCVARNDIAKGSVIEDSDVAFRRPGDGIPPLDAKYIVGRTASRRILSGSIIRREMFE